MNNNTTTPTWWETTVSNLQEYQIIIYLAVAIIAILTFTINRKKYIKERNADWKSKFKVIRETSNIISITNEGSTASIESLKINDQDAFSHESIEVKPLSKKLTNSEGLRVTILRRDNTLNGTFVVNITWKDKFSKRRLWNKSETKSYPV